MDKAIFYPTAVLGLILIFIYWLRCRKSGVEFSQAVIVNVTLQSSGIVCGVLLIAGCISDEARNLLSEIDLYIFISGLVVLVGAVKAIHKDVFQSTQKNTDVVISNKSIQQTADASAD